jgi:hypothetical protein
MVAHACNPSTGETEAKGLQVLGQLSYIVRTVSKNKTQTKIWVNSQLSSTGVGTLMAAVTQLLD